MCDKTNDNIDMSERSGLTWFISKFIAIYVRQWLSDLL